MKQLIKKTKIIWLLVVAVSFFGCEEDDDATLPQIETNFVHSIDEDRGVVTFLNLSENADSYSWDFGDGTSSTEINPTKVYPTGNYTVVLTAKNTAGASGTFEDNIVINIPLPINFPINFDDPNVRYDITTFNGASFTIVDNPDPSGTNTSTGKVGSITNGGAAFEGIFFDLGMPLDLSLVKSSQTALKSVQMNFWSDTPIDVLMKLENGTGADVETTASHGGTGWELIRFDFDSDASYSRITLFVDGPGTTAGTFYFDDIEQVETPEPTSGCDDTPVAATSLPLDFEGCATFPSSDNFGAGITSELAPNPSKEGINTSDFVLKVDKPTDSDFFAGIQNTFEDGFDLTTTDVFKLKIYSTKANAVFRFELLANPNDGSIGNPAPVFVTVPNADEWTEVEFTFTNLPAAPTAYNQLVIKPDNDESDSPITAGGTYYFDDLTLNEGAGSGGGGSTNDDTILNFENNLAGVTTSEFETGGALVANPSSSGINTSANVYEASYNNGNQWWGGIGFVIDGGLDQATTVYKAKFYSTVAPTNVLFQVEVDGTNAPVGDVQTITTANEWVELTFTLANIPAGVNRILIRPDVGDQTGTKPNTGSLFIDDIAEGDSGSGGGDTVAPVITLNGDAVVNLTVGGNFTDPGATALDDVDGDISGSIVVGGDSVDTNTEGTYVITYNVSDAAGNAATQVTRTVNVTASTSTALLDFENSLTGVTASEFETSGALISNPVSGGINTSANVYEASYTNGNQWWGGIGFVFDSGLDQANTVYKAKFYSTVAPTNVLFQVEVDGTNAPVGDVQTINTANEWVELTFTLANIPAGVNRILIRPDVGDQTGTKPNTGSLYIDDIIEAGSGSGGGGGTSGGCSDTPIAATELPLDFEGCQTFVSSFSSIGDNGVVPSLDANPSKSGINTSDNVLKVVRASGINRWGGIQNAFPAGTIDITTKVFKVKVYSSIADVTYRFELSLNPQTDPVTGNPPPTFVQVSGGANEWVEIEFTFTGLPASPTTYNQLVIKPDNPDGSDGEVTAAEQTFYFDDLRLE